MSSDNLLHQGDIVDIQYGFGSGENEKMVSISAHWSSEFGFLFNNADVAAALGCQEANVRKHKLKDEIRQDHHWILETQAFPERDLKGRPATYWTYAGVLRLGMLCQSTQAAEFRDSMEQLLAEYEWSENSETYDREDSSMRAMGKPSRRPDKGQQWYGILMEARRVHLVSPEDAPEDIESEVQ